MAAVDILNESGKIEKLYQKKTPLEHILLRPDSYVGSIKKEEKSMWVYDSATDSIVERKISYNPALYKIFDEILVNASDHKIRDGKMTLIRIDIKREKNMIRIWNNGKGIEVVKHKKEGVYVPTLIFGHLLTSTNFNDDEKKVVGGRNGYGAKLCNIFSTEFTVETSSKEYNKSFKQTWTNNMYNHSDCVLGEPAKEDFTCITFHPDLKRFQMEQLDDDIVGLFSRRAYDIAACTHGVTVYLNGKQIPVKNFKDYVELYTKCEKDCGRDPLKVVYEKYGDRWEVAVTTSVSDTFTQVSFVNSISTSKGGSHINYIVDQLASKLLDKAKKKIKDNTQAAQLKPAIVKSNLWVFVRCLIENPSFDSQTKENMTLQAKDFGSTCKISDEFIDKVSKLVIDRITLWSKLKNQQMLDKKCSKTKVTRIKDMEKLTDASKAGTKESQKCTLILTEGDSAKTLAVSGLSVVGGDYYGAFPLKGKLLNVREASSKQVMDNAEIENLIKIIGLNTQMKYETPESMQKLRYGKIMIMTDQDQDGSHIKGLIINFIHNFWPNLIKQNFVVQFITPLVKAFKGRQVLSFYSLPELAEWQKNTPDSSSWRLKYYKGLGTSTSEEAKEYFSDMRRHLIKFRYSGENDEKSIVLAFGKNKADERKEWLTNWMEGCKRRREEGVDEEYLYSSGTTAITYDEFINKELILFSNADNERSIPSLVDGLKPGQRKVLFTCLNRSGNKEIKVAQLSGSVAEKSAYHHGEASLTKTIVNLAQDFVGSNNINLLVPQGQFGSRLKGGSDSASPRYIFTRLNEVSRHIFHSKDTNILKYLFDDNQQVEPEWYIPVIPMILVNGADGIGTGWSCKIPNFNPMDLIENIRRMLNGEEPIKMHPWFRGFKGTISEVSANKYVVSGEIAKLSDTTIEITELPVRVWTDPYKKSVMETYMYPPEKANAQITDYQEHNTDKTVRFVVEMTRQKFDEAEQIGFHKFFKCQSQMTCSNMVLFDEMGVIRKYNSAEEILKTFYRVRFDMYVKRKQFLVGELEAETLLLENQARFILEKIEGLIKVENVKIKALKDQLLNRKYLSDPIKAFRKKFIKCNIEENDDNDDEENASKGPDFKYLIDMRICQLTEEEKDKLLTNRDARQEELRLLRSKTPEDLWLHDLAELENSLNVFFKHKSDEETPSDTSDNKKKPVGGGKKGGKVKTHVDSRPSPFGRRIEPKIDEDTIKKMSSESEKKKKENVIKKQQQMMQDFVNSNGSREDVNMSDAGDDDYNDEPKPLAQRLADKGVTDINLLAKVKPKPAPRKKQVGIVEINKQKQPKEPKRKSGSPKKKKRQPWDSGSDDDENKSDDALFESIDDDIIPRKTAPKRNAAKQVKYIVDSDEEEEEEKTSNAAKPESSSSKNDDADYDPVGDSNGAAEKVTQIPKETLSEKFDKPKQLKQKKLFDHLEGNDEEQPPQKKAKTATAAKRTKKVVDKEIKEAKPKAPRKPRAPKKPKSASSGEDDANDIFKPTKSDEPVKERVRRNVPQKQYVDLADDSDQSASIPSDGGDDDDSDFDFSKVKKTKTVKKKGKLVSDSD